LPPCAPCPGVDKRRSPAARLRPLHSAIQMHDHQRNSAPDSAASHGIPEQHLHTLPVPPPCSRDPHLEACGACVLQASPNGLARNHSSGLAESVRSGTVSSSRPVSHPDLPPAAAARIVLIRYIRLLYWTQPEGLAQPSSGLSRFTTLWKGAHGCWVRAIAPCPTAYGSPSATRCLQMNGRTLHMAGCRQSLECGTQHAPTDR